MNIKEFDCNVNILNSILWQDENNDQLKKIIEMKQEWYNANACEFWDDWVKDVFNLNTANEFGLSVWSVILNMRLFATNDASDENYNAFGFDSDNAYNFGFGNFATDANQSFLLSVEQKRLILKMRFFQLVTRCTIPEINKFMASIFGVGVVYALDGNDMTMTYVNTQRIEPELLRAIKELDLFPRPNSVELKFVDSSYESFGFNGESSNFYNGNFIGG